MYLVANYRWLSLLAVFSSICAKEIESEVKCVDVADWKDAYNDGCEWYASQPGSCEHFGDCCENEGYTASKACCSCGGGREMDLSDKTLHQKEISSIRHCKDIIGWKDESSKDCSWYKENDPNCENYGWTAIGTNEVYAFQACCTCGGGSTYEKDLPRETIEVLSTSISSSFSDSLSGSSTSSSSSSESSSSSSTGSSSSSSSESSSSSSTGSSSSTSTGSSSSSSSGTSSSSATESSSSSSSESSSSSSTLSGSQTSSSSSSESSSFSSTGSSSSTSSESSSSSSTLSGSLSSSSSSSESSSSSSTGSSSKS